MAVRDDIETLRLFNRLVAELNDSAFVRALREGGERFILEGGPFRAIRQGGATSDEMRSFILTFRLFHHGNQDGLTLREIAAVYERHPVSETLKVELQAIRDEVSRYLAGPTPLDVFGERISRDELLNVWLYGELAHRNPDKRARIEEWRVADDVRPIFQHEFEAIAAGFLQAIFWVRNNNLAALAELEGTAA